MATRWPAASYAPRVSRTQKERREATIARLIDASITVIAELGYSRASAQVIADRAGVSSGALFRHFATMTDFITATAREAMTRQMGTFAARLAEVPEADISVVLQIVRENCATTTNNVMQELLVAARTDDTLRAALQPALQEFAVHMLGNAHLAIGNDVGLDEQELTTWLFMITDMFDFEALVQPLRPYPELVQLRVPLLAQLFTERLARASALPRRDAARAPGAMDQHVAATTPRGKLLLAAVAAVADRGYADTTVTDIVARAGMSRRTFYELHQDKDECIAAAFQFAVEFMETQLAEAFDIDGGDWRARVHAALDAYLRVLAADTACARVLHVEWLAAGQRLNIQRSRAKAVLARRAQGVFRLGRESGDLPADIPNHLFDALIGAIDDRIRECLNGPGAQALPLLTPDLYELTLALFGATNTAPPTHH